MQTAKGYLFEHETLKHLASPGPFHFDCARIRLIAARFSAYPATL